MRIEQLQDISDKLRALNLAWDVFQQYEACDYSNEGIQNFKNFITSNDAIENLIMYGAWIEQDLRGMIAMRLPTHISLFFVSSKHQHQGIGKALFQHCIQNLVSSNITVNSSPYAVLIYEKLGFIALQEEQLKDGIRFTPMKYIHMKKIHYQ